MLRHTSRFALVLTCMVLAIPIAFSQAVSFTTFSSPYLDSLHADFNSDGREDFIPATAQENLEQMDGWAAIVNDEDAELRAFLVGRFRHIHKPLN